MMLLKRISKKQMDLNKYFIEHINYPLMEAIRGNHIRSYISELKKTEHMSAADLHSFQLSKLQKLLLHSVENVPAYQGFSHLIPQIDEDPFKALKLFPLLTKQAFRNNADSYKTVGKEVKDVIVNRTGGSTGEPVRFLLDRYSVEHYEAARWRGLSWWGIGIGDRSVMVWGSPLELDQNKLWKYKLKEKYLKNRIVIPAYDLDPGSVPAYIDMIDRFKPKYIYGYASSLFTLAKLIIANGRYLKNAPCAVVSTAETLHDHQRLTIEKAFNCRTVNEYGARDGGILAYECPNGSMHISSENVFIEPIGLPRRASENEKVGGADSSGLIAITDLNNYIMPRLRYILGDIGILSAMDGIPSKLCGCGVSLPILKGIEGREDDMFLTKDNSYVHGHYFNHIARNLKSIRQFQIIQHDRDNITLRIAGNNGNTADLKEIDTFQKAIVDKMGDVNLTLDYVDKIKTADSGKFRYAIREFPIM